MGILEHLALRELELISTTESLQVTIESKIFEKGILETGKLYRAIFKQYAELSSTNSEALKRGLFFIWYCNVEPHFISGMDFFEIEDQNLVIASLENYFISKDFDSELEWMFSYYCSWSFLLTIFKIFTLFQLKLGEYEDKIELPAFIDRVEMNNRGTMGDYWNSLTHFSK